MTCAQALETGACSVTMSKEKPEHLTYLQEFRVEPCSLFKQHTCQSHRPYTCFFWHFANQRRRRCVLKSDGTFNYSPDVYCVKYDESTGICPDDERCAYLHRVYGDIERKYHLRYYKTTLCVHGTDTAGQCVKNGVHCPFAHGLDDIREPVFERRDSELMNGESHSTVELLENRDRLSYVVEDPIWEDQEHVLAYYKTELCKKPPRLCRQGYACPYYHNSKDRRRSPLDIKYRSTPCPSVKHADEWSSPEACESGDNCSYCHTRTEQQFHPEIYKSSKCNDMLLHGYCPRSSFCAFAHTDGELCAERVLSKRHKFGGSASTIGSSNMGCFPSPVGEPGSVFTMATELRRTHSGASPYGEMFSGRATAVNESSLSYSAVLKQQRRYTMPAPRSGKLDAESDGAFSYPKAPGFERGLQSPYRDRACSSLLPAASGDKSARTIFGFYDLANYDSGILSSSHNLTGDYLSSPLGGQSNKLDQVENLDALIGSLADDLNMDDVVLPTINENEEKAVDSAFPFAGMTYSSASVTSTNSSHLKGVNIYKQGYNAYCDMPQSQLSTTAGSNGLYNFHEENALLKVQPTQGYGVAGFHDAMVEPFAASQTPGHADAMGTLRSRLTGMDMDECLLRTTKTCEVWKREAEEQRRRAQIAEQEKLQALSERDKALNQLACLQFEMHLLKTGNFSPSASNDSMSNDQLEDYKNRLQVELEKVNRRLESSAGPMCARCGRHVNDRLPSVHCPVCTPSCKMGSSSSAVA